MTDQKQPQRRPSCFGDLKTVFPMTKSGLRDTPLACLACVFKTECLRAAMDGAGGLDVRREAVDRAYAAGMMSFFQRWSRRKSLFRQKQRIGKAPGAKEPG
jgi:hypothetical protein